MDQASPDDGGGAVLILFFFFFLIVVFLSTTTVLLRSGKLNNLISNISSNNPVLGNLLSNVAGQRGPLGGAPGGAPGTGRTPGGAPGGTPNGTPGRGGAIPVQAGGGAGNQQSTMQNVIESLGDNADMIIAQVGVDIAATLASEQKAIAKYIMKRGMKNPATKALFEKGASKMLKKTFTGRLKNVFSKLTAKTLGKLGARWTKSAAQAGKTATLIAEKAAREAGERAAETAARIAAQTAAKTAAKQATTASLGPIGWAYDAVTVVSIGLDIANAGNYAELAQTSDLLQIKKEIDREVLNVNLACSTVPPTADCPMDPDAPPPPIDPDTETKPGRYPSFYGPLDKEQSDDYAAFYTKLTDKVVDLVTNKPYQPRVQALFDQMNLDYGQLFAEAFRNAGVDPDTVQIPGIPDDQFAATFIAYWSDADSDYFYNKAFDALCEDAGGVVFSAGQGWDRQCTYRTENECHAQYPWPPPDDAGDLTYTEWRAKPWFNQFKNTDGTNTLDMASIPSDGACIVASPGLHQLCDQEIKTGSGTAKNIYQRNTGECYNSPELCHIKGVAYASAMDPGSMANLTDHPLPSCYVNDSMRACENIVGITICRALQSGGDVAGARDLRDTNIQTSDPVVDAFANQAEGFAASIGASYLTGREGIIAGFSVMSGGQQTYDQIEQGLQDTVAVAGNGLTNLANRSEQGSVTAALALPSAAIVAGASLAIAAIGSAFSALDTAVTASRTQNYPQPAWCGNGPTCRPGETIVSGGRDWRSCEILNCRCGGVITNGICCPEFHTGSMVNGQAKCTPMPFPSWWSEAAKNSCQRCSEGYNREEAVNRRMEDVCYDRYDGYSYDPSTEEYQQVFTPVCEQQERYDTVYTWVPGSCEGTTTDRDPRAFRSLAEYCAAGQTGQERADQAWSNQVAAEQQAWLDNWANSQPTSDAWYTNQ